MPSRSNKSSLPCQTIKHSLHEMSNFPYTKCQTLLTDKGKGWVYENGMISKREVMVHKKNLSSSRQ